LRTRRWLGYRKEGKEDASMRRATLLTLVAVLLVAMTASAALALNIRGTNGPDQLTGTSKADTINALGGKDEVRGLRGPDDINGGFGPDLLHGAQGNDEFSGAPGDDTVIGNVGNDVIRGGVGRDTLEGRGDDDRIIAAGDGQRDMVNCGSGTDVAVVVLNDVVDGQLVESVLGVGNLVGTIGSCETVEVRLLQ
jgi:Ca2+-binding RTX toxin-like protein